MLAAYVQVTASELADLGDDPASIPALFAPDMSMAPFLGAAEQVRERMQQSAPRLFSQALATLDPSVRDRLAWRLGIEPDELGTDAAGDALLRLMGGEGLRSDDAARRAADDDRPSLSLDKAWHGVSYLLADGYEPAAGPPGNAVLGGTEIGDDDHGYGRARFFVPAEVEEIAESLARPGLEAELRGRYRPEEMTELGVYPGGWDDEALDWLLNAFRDLREFFREAAAQHAAVLTCLV